MEKNKQGLLAVITGTSGAGKDSVLEGVMEGLEGASRIVTHASREPRKGEIDGVHYYFISEKEFKEKLDNDEFFEYVKYGGSYKGTHKDSLLPALDGEILIWRIDMSRAGIVEDTIREKLDEETAERLIKRTVVVLIDVPDEETALKRAKSRDGENFDESEYKKRRQLDIQAIENGKFTNIIENETGLLDETVKKVLALFESILTQE